MNVELTATIIGTTASVIAVVVTILITTRSTQKIIERGNESTQKIIGRGNESTQKILDKLTDILKETHCTTLKIAVGMKANARIHGWKCAENVTDIKEIEKVAEEYEYDPALKICYYKPKKSTAL